MKIAMVKGVAIVAEHFRIAQDGTAEYAGGAHIWVAGALYPIFLNGVSAREIADAVFAADAYGSSVPEKP